MEGGSYQKGNEHSKGFRKGEHMQGSSSNNRKRQEKNIDPWCWVLDLGNGQRSKTQSEKDCCCGGGFVDLALCEPFSGNSEQMLLVYL